MIGCLIVEGGFYKKILPSSLQSFIEKEIGKKEVFLKSTHMPAKRRVISRQSAVWSMILLTGVPAP